MDVHETALGRIVPAYQTQTILEDQILSVLFDYRMSKQNPANAPMKLSNIARSAATDEKLVIAALEALVQEKKVEERESFQGERAFSMTGLGVRFVRDMPQGIDSVP
jgi:hypothetical protein